MKNPEKYFDHVENSLRRDLNLGILIAKFKRKYRKQRMCPASTVFEHVNYLIALGAVICEADKIFYVPSCRTKTFAYRQMELIAA